VTQEDQVLTHLQTFGSITARRAMVDYSIAQLPARIFRLRARGVKIDTVDVLGVNRFGHPVRFAEYRLRA